MTNSKGKVKQRLSLRRGRISGRIDSITTNLGEILLNNQGLPIPRQLM